jgi:glycine cleavage system H protein
MKFTESHEWVKQNENSAYIGITDHAQKEVGEIVFIELPKVGDRLIPGQEFCVIESSKAAADIYSPISGEVIEVNETLKKNPSLLNESPEEKGWICKVALSNPTEYDHLLDKIAYSELIS